MENQALTRYLSKGYILALTFIALLALTANQILIYSISTQKDYASIINISGRQRMLCQRIALLSHGLVTAPNSPAVVDKKAELIIAVNLMRASHLALLEGSKELNVALDVLVTANHIYFESPTLLDAQVRTFLSAATSLHMAETSSLSYDNIDLLTIESLAHSKLPKALNEVVTHFESQSHAQIKEIQTLENYILFATWFVLLLEVFLIFRPMVRSVVKSESLLKQALKEAQKANETKRVFLNNLSHEIRTPMNAIMSLAKLLKDESIGQKAQDFSQTIYLASSALSTLLNNIIDYANLSSGKIHLHKQHFKLGEMVEEIRQHWSQVAEKKGLDFKLEYNVNDCPPLLGDVLRIKQLLSYLIENAIKFSQAGEVRVTIGVETRTDSVLFSASIKDAGIGIPQEQHATILEGFTQVDGSLTRKFGGLGLGLSLSKQLVNCMGGSFHFDSIKDKGSCFEVKLPLALAPKTQPSEANTSLLLPPSVNYVLLVEDNIVNQKVAKHILDKMGAKVELASNGQEALLKVQNRAFDIILMDLQMPIMDGFTATLAIRALGEKFTDIPIIAVSANISSEIVHCISVGMNGFVDKPISIEKLYDEIIKHAK